MSELAAPARPPTNHFPLSRPHGVLLGVAYRPRPGADWFRGELSLLHADEVLLQVRGPVESALVDLWIPSTDGRVVLTSARVLRSWPTPRPGAPDGRALICTIDHLSDDVAPALEAAASVDGLLPTLAP